MQTIRLARVYNEESIKFSHMRKTFEKRLIGHPVIRIKLANMARQVECIHVFLEQGSYNYDKMVDN